jgi:hypothetical protein
LALATFSTAGVALADDDQPGQAQQPSQMQQPSQGQMPSEAQPPSQRPMPSQTTTQKMSASATVEKIDIKKRELSLKDEQGNQFMVEVPEDVTRFENIKKGDKVNVDYYESVALSLKKPEKGEKPSASEMTMSGRAAGNLPGGMTGRRITATATVTKVDVANNKVSIKAPDGKMDTITVSDPGLQSDLGKLKKGDRIQATYTEAMAITVSPKNKE